MNALQARAKMGELVSMVSIHIRVIVMSVTEETTVKQISTNARQTHVKMVEPV